MCKKFAVLGYETILMLMSIIYSILGILGIFFTSYVDKYEKVEIQLDNILLHILFFSLISGIWIIYYIKVISKITVDKILKIWGGYAVGIGSIWILMARVIPTFDQQYVSDCAVGFLNGNYGSLSSGGYLRCCKHQLGLVLFEEVVYRIFGAGNVSALMMLNLVSVVLSGILLYMILKMTGANEHVLKTYLMLLFLSLQPLLYITFVYGTLIGLTFGICMIFLFLKFMKKTGIKRWMYLIGGMFAGGIAISLKKNYLIFIVAIFIVLLLEALRKREFLLIVAGLLILSMCYTPKILEEYVEFRSGIEIEGSMPSLLYVAMGLQEGDCANGWFNGYNNIIYNKYYPDTESMKQEAKESIEKSVHNFGMHKKYAICFFGEKIISQWEEPLFQALFIGGHEEDHNSELSAITISIYQGGIRTYLYMIYNSITAMIWLAGAYGCWLNRKSEEPAILVLCLIVLGGFLFHIIWEAKAQYILPYYILTLPLASMGIEKMIFRGLGKKILKRISSANVSDV